MTQQPVILADYDLDKNCWKAHEVFYYMVTFLH